MSHSVNTPFFDAIERHNRLLAIKKELAEIERELEEAASEQKDLRLEEIQNQYAW